MCGIALLIDKHNLLDSNSLMKIFLQNLHHRGPDSSHFAQDKFGSGTIYIGHTLLRITDIFSEHKSLCETASYFLSFNGEVYNHKEFDAKNLQTTSDTEKLAQALLKEEKELVLNKINGIFSFAFFDKSKKEVLLARDAQGIKPLFYYQDHEVFIAASEIGALLKTGLVKSRLNTDSIHHFLNYRYAQIGNTFFNNIHELMPGGFIEITENGFRSDSFIKPIPNKFQSNLSLEKILEDVVKDQVLSFEKVGFMLSGGIDSSLLLSIASKYETKIPCYSLVYDHQIYQSGTLDSEYAKRVADVCDAEYIPIHLGPEDLQLFDDFSKKVDQPVADPAAFLTYLIAQKAGKEVRVLINGAGADELFGGYRRHEITNKYFQFSWLFVALNRLGILKNKQAISQFYKALEDDHFEYSSLTKLQFGDNIFDYKTESKVKTLQDSLRFDQQNYLIGDVLHLTDHSSMLQNIETRVPFLDKRVLDFQSNLTNNELKNGIGKKILKEILIKNNLSFVAKRKKEGFGMPLQDWLISETWFSKELHEKLNPIFIYIDFTGFQRMLEAHQNRKKDFRNEIWAAKVLSSFLKKHSS